MSEASKATRNAVTHALDALEMINFNNGFEAAIDALDELSDLKHNQGAPTYAEVLRWAAKELRGENA